MKRVLLSLWRDEVGLVQSTELVFITSIVGIGMLVGLSAYRDGMVDELADSAHAVGALNQSYGLSISANAPAGITDGFSLEMIARDIEGLRAIAVVIVVLFPDGQVNIGWAGIEIFGVLGALLGGGSMRAWLATSWTAGWPRFLRFPGTVL